MSELLVNTIKKADGTGSLSVPAESGTVVTTASPSLGRRNLIINGAGMIHQRGGTINNGASAYIYGLDRWALYGNDAADFSIAQDSSTAPAEFINSIKVTSLAATTAAGAYGLAQKIEGLNSSHLRFGSSGAQTITASFWVRSSITGTYAFSLFNSGGNRSYISEYTISAADTWEYKTVTVVGDTSGTWLNTSGIGVIAWWDLGSSSGFNNTKDQWNATLDTRTTSTVDWIATNGATFYITGVQLEVGSVASSYEHRSYGEELALCQRYYEQVGNGASALANSSTQFWTGYTFKVEKRAEPTASVIASTVRYFKFGLANRDNSSPSIGGGYYSPRSSIILIEGFSGLTANESAMSGGSITNHRDVIFAFDAEL